MIKVLTYWISILFMLGVLALSIAGKARAIPIGSEIFRVGTIDRSYLHNDGIQPRIPGLQHAFFEMLYDDFGFFMPETFYSTQWPVRGGSLGAVIQGVLRHKGWENPLLLDPKSRQQVRLGCPFQLKHGTGDWYEWNDEISPLDAVEFLEDGNWSWRVRGLDPLDYNKCAPWQTTTENDNIRFGPHSTADCRHILFRNNDAPFAIQWEFYGEQADRVLEQPPFVSLDWGEFVADPMQYIIVGSEGPVIYQENHYGWGGTSRRVSDTPDGLYDGFLLTSCIEVGPSNAVCFTEPLLYSEFTYQGSPERIDYHMELDHPGSGQSITFGCFNVINGVDL